MRAREFIVERHFSKRKSSVMPFTKMFPTMPSSDTYQAYRFGMAMANHTMKHPEGPAQQKAVIVAYTPEEEDIIRGGESQTGHQGVEIADHGSHETADTYKQSPIAPAKRNRWGV